MMRVAVSLLAVAVLFGCRGPMASAPANAERLDGSRTLAYTIKEKPSAMAEANRLGIWYPASDFEAVGLYLQPGEEVVVSLEHLEGSSFPELLVGTYSRHQSGDEPTPYILSPGSNVISDADGGMLYLKYVTEDEPSGKVALRFFGGMSVPVYRLGETTHADWLAMLEKMSSPDVLLISKSTLIVVSRESALQYADFNPEEMLHTLDRISALQDRISGIDGSSDLHRPNVHKLLITETADPDPDFFMAAQEHRIMVPTRNIGRLMDPGKLISKGWGLWHEMGHHRQMVNWDWDAVDEVTVNIYSLATLYGLPGTMTWLKGDRVWDDLERYFCLPLDERDYNSSKLLSAKARLAMFRQLWLAYGDEFYIRLHQLAREDNASDSPSVEPRYQSSDEEKMALFMEVASLACGYNLKDFFIQWGFQLPAESFQTLDALNLPDTREDLVLLRE